jgi:hypothetical protein
MVNQIPIRAFCHLGGESFSLAAMVVFCNQEYESALRPGHAP